MFTLAGSFVPGTFVVAGPTRRNDMMKPNRFRIFWVKIRCIDPIRRLFGREAVSAQDVLHQEEALAPTQFAEKRILERRRTNRRKVTAFISIGMLSVFSGGIIVGVVPLLGMKATDSTDFCI